MTKAAVPLWFRQLVKAAIGRSGSQEVLAAKLGITQPNLGKYLAGRQMPSLAVVDQLLRYMGGDISRALPDYEPPVTEDAPRMAVHGAVTAGKVEWSEDAQRIREVVAWPELWKNSQYWGYTDPVLTSEGTQAVVLLEVIGDSMEPTYRDGELIACRQPKNPHELPEGTPCVIRDADGQTFKLLRRAVKGQVIGEPINRQHRLIVFDRSPPEIPLVIVGKLDPGARGNVTDLTKIPGVRKGLK